VAIRNGSAIVVANDDWTVRTKALAFPRPWSGAAETVATYVGAAASDPRVEYDPGSGQPVVVYGDEDGFRLKSAVRGSGGWAAAPELENTTPNRAILAALVPHPSGLVAVWRRSNGAGLAVSRYNGTWDGPHTFAGDWTLATAAANADGDIVVAAEPS